MRKPLVLKITEYSICLRENEKNMLIPIYEESLAIFSSFLDLAKAGKSSEDKEYVKYLNGQISILKAAINDLNSIQMISFSSGDIPKICCLIAPIMTEYQTNKDLCSILESFTEVFNLLIGEK